jgi:hypothetical protein
MIAIATLLVALSPAQAQDCGVIIPRETSKAVYDDENDWVAVNEVGAVVQLDSGCGDPDIIGDGECQWILHDPATTDGQGVGKLVDIDQESNQGAAIVANRVWYQTPGDLNDCVDVRAIVELDCSRLDDENETAGDSVVVVTKSPYEEKCSVTGGGCIAPQGSGVQEAGVLFLLPLIGLLRRREDEA